MDLFHFFFFAARSILQCFENTSSATFLVRKVVGALHLLAPRSSIFTTFPVTPTSPDTSCYLTTELGYPCTTVTTHTPEVTVRFCLFALVDLDARSAPQRSGSSCALRLSSPRHILFFWIYLCTTMLCFSYASTFACYNQIGLSVVCLDGERDKVELL